MESPLIFIRNRRISTHLFCFSVLIALFAFHTLGAQPRITYPPLYTNDQPSDTTLIKKLFRSYDTLSNLKKRKEAIALLKTILAKSQKAHYRRGISVALNRLGKEYVFEGKFDTAISYMNTALPQAELPENIINSNILYNTMGLAYSALGKYDEALKYYYKALDVVGRVKMDNGTDSVGLYFNIGVVWARMEEYNYATRMFMAASNIAQRTGNLAEEELTYLNIGECYNRMKQWDLAEDYYRKSLAITKRQNKAGGISSAYASLAEVMKVKGDYTMALRYADSAEAINITINMSAYQNWHTKVVRGEILMEMGRYSEAAPMLITAANEIEKMNHMELKEVIQPDVARLYALTHNYKQAYGYLKKYNDTRDSLFKKEKARTLDAWTNLQLVEKDKGILAQKLYISKQEHQITQKRYWTGGTIVGSLLLLSLSVVVVRNQRHKQVLQKNEIDTLRHNREIAELKAQMQGEEHERQRIAHELNDNMAARLWALKLSVEQMKSQNANMPGRHKQISEIYDKLTLAAADLRKTAHNLMPDLLLEEGLATALAAACEKMNTDHKPEIDFREYGNVPRIEKEIELSIYRMVQELMQNALKHAKNATYVLVQLSCAGTVLNITVEDNGTAAGIKENKGGIGLQRIKKRTIALRGHFDLQCMPGKGTTAYLEFDLQHFL